jgi:DNA-binding transcriptional LysR family regulator
MQMPSSQAQPATVYRDAMPPARAPRRQRQSSVTAPASPSGNEFDVGQLLFFFAVAETLSFTKAAQRLGIDQSWLSHKIRQFEASLGLNLFIRNTRNVELTRAGLALLDPARRLAEVADQARAATDMLQMAMIGIVRVGALPFSFPDRHRTALLDRFMTEYPDVQMLVTNGPTPLLLDQLLAGRIDLAFVSAPFDMTGIDALLLRENSYCLLMPKDHALAAVPTVTAESLRGVRVVVPSEHFSPATYATYYRPLVDAGIIPVPVPEFQCSVTYGSQWGLPVVCTRYAAERLRTAGLVIRPLDFVPPCKKYLIRLANHRTPSQTLLWEMAEAAADPQVARA